MRRNRRRSLLIRNHPRRRSRLDWDLIANWAWIFALGWGVTYLGACLGYELIRLVFALLTGGE